MRLRNRKGMPRICTRLGNIWIKSVSTLVQSGFVLYATNMHKKLKCGIPLERWDVSWREENDTFWKEMEEKRTTFQTPSVDLRERLKRLFSDRLDKPNNRLATVWFPSARFRASAIISCSISLSVGNS